MSSATFNTISTTTQGGIVSTSTTADSSYAFTSCTFSTISSVSGGIIIDQSACSSVNVRTFTSCTFS